MAKVISISNQKGGVGKTTTALALASVLAKQENRVLLIDCDGSNSTATKCVAKQLDVNPKYFDPTLTDAILRHNAGKNAARDVEDAIMKSGEGYDFLPADDKLVTASISLSMQNDLEIRFKTMDHLLAPLRERYDYIIMDSAPTLDIFTINQFIASDELIIVTQCQEASTEAVNELLKTVNEYVLPLKQDFKIAGILMTMLDRREMYSIEVLEDFRKYQKVRVFDAVIPHSVTAKRYIEKGFSVVTTNPTHKVTRAYEDFAKEFTRGSYEKDIYSN